MSYPDVSMVMACSLMIASVLFLMSLADRRRR